MKRPKKEKMNIKKGKTCWYTALTKVIKKISTKKKKCEDTAGYQNELVLNTAQLSFTISPLWKTRLSFPSLKTLYMQGISHINNSKPSKSTPSSHLSSLISILNPRNSFQERLPYLRRDPWLPVRDWRQVNFSGQGAGWAAGVTFSSSHIALSLQHRL